MSENTNIDWNQDFTSGFIEATSGTTNEILDPGNYEFKIVYFTRRTSNGAAYKGSPMAELHYELGGCLIRDYIILNTSFKKKIANFLNAVFGQQDVPKGFWDRLVGMNIKLEVGKYEDEYNGNRFFKNDIKKYLPKDLSQSMGAFDTVHIPTRKEPPKANDFGSVPPMDDRLPF